ncbi:MAG: winged helix-turn-helix domain-containing protein [Candidatus Bathyarchaeia archaeon]
MQKKLNAHKICEALSDPTRTKILKFLINEHPEARTISQIEKILPKPVSATTVSFHLKKLREAGLILTNGHKRGFKAARKAINIEFGNNGFHIEEE